MFTALAEFVITTVFVTAMAVLFYISIFEGGKKK